MVEPRGCHRTLTGAERIVAIGDLRAYCDRLGRACTQVEFNAHCRGQGLGRPWTAAQLKGGALRGWGDVLAQAGRPGQVFRQRQHRTPRIVGPQRARCQNAPDCARTPEPGYRFCRLCRKAWEGVEPDTGIVGEGRSVRIR